MVPGVLEHPDGQLVLAGDPKQLGPVLRSPVAIRCGLQKSLLERLMATTKDPESQAITIYQRGKNTLEME